LTVSTLPNPLSHRPSGTGVSVPEPTAGKDGARDEETQEAQKNRESTKEKGQRGKGRECFFPFAPLSLCPFFCAFCLPFGTKLLVR
jgi:hypothetical protein